MVPRRATIADAAAAAELYLRARHASVPAIPPLVHADAEVRRWFSEVVLPEREVWVIGGGASGPAGLPVLEGEWVDQLYVDPARTRQGIGSELLEVAKQQRPAGLDLWVFQSNERAIAFYERHGFHEVDRTDGDNEEGAPDLRLHWP